MLLIKKIILSGLFLLFISLSGFVVTSSAATLTWTGGGADNLASNAANWTGNIIPHHGDSVVFDATSAKDCTWDINETLSSISLTPAYAGTVTQTAILKSVAITGIAPAATTDPASAINGNRATLNATVNPNGSETSVYFEWGTSTSYGNTTPAQTISVGTSNIVVTANITGLSMNTTYHYRVVALNSGGATTGADVAFTTPPIAITLTSPSDGSTISRPDVMVKGTIATTGVNETGVTVNGIVGTVYNNQFVVNHVPLTDGANTITVTATDTAGNTATTSRTVNAVTTGTYIRLNANPESGVAPFETTLKIDGSFSIDNSGMSVTGPGSVEFLPGDLADEYQMRMTVPGIYYFTASVNGSDNIVYENTVAIIVLNKNQLDTLLKAKWDGMKGKLLANDIEGSLDYLVYAVRDTYREMFQQYGADKIAAILSTNTGFNLSVNYGKVAECGAIKTEDDGTEYSYPVRFVLDENGIWRIMGF
jgi:hypothetical protein